jgi:spermidine/putrescine transport system permease protein
MIFRKSAPRVLANLITLMAFVGLYFPLLVMFIYSFIDRTQDLSGNEISVWTLRWYQKAISNAQTLNALEVSIWVGVCSTLVSTVLGTLGALALQRARFIGREAFGVFFYVPLVMPEIVMGLSLLIWFVRLGIPLGKLCIILGHVTFSLSYVLISVRSRLEDFDPSIEEAARDLGATPWQTFWKVTLPLIAPAILSGALIAFTLSFDDFLVTFFTAGVGSDTLPVRIYSMIKFGMSPEIHALSSLVLGATLVLVLCFFRPRQSRALG